MTSVYFSNKKSEWFSKLQENLENHDVVIAESTPKTAPKVADLSHLRPDKRIRGD